MQPLHTAEAMLLLCVVLLSSPAAAQNPPPPPPPMPPPQITACPATDQWECAALYLSSPTPNQCTWDMLSSRCIDCTGTVPEKCNATVSVAPMCRYNLAMSQCQRRAIACGDVSTRELCSSARAHSDFEQCVWREDSNSCGRCVDFSSSAPCPRSVCGLNTASECVSQYALCNSIVAETECGRVNETWNCYFNATYNKCLWCGSHTNAESCALAPACQWRRTGMCLSASGYDPALDGPLPAATPSFPSWGIGVIAALGALLLAAAVAGFLWLRQWRQVHMAPLTLEEEDALKLMRSKGVSSSFNNVTDSARESLTSNTQQSALTTSGMKLSGLSMPRDDGRPRSDSLALKAPALYAGGKVQKLKLLGRGTSGSVYSCALPDGSTIAMKEILLPSGAAGVTDETVANVMKEVDVVSSLDHPGVVRFYGAAMEGGEHRLTIFMEYVPGGSLASAASSMPLPMSEELGRVYARQLVSALAYVHAQGVVHRDVKCDNILLMSDGQIKLSDFGASKTIGTGTMATRNAQTMIGTPFFMAPEILMFGDEDTANSGYGRRADIWSLGITILEMLECGKAPWPPFPSTGAAFMHIASPGAMPIIPDRLSDDAKDFLLRCCCRDPTQRATAEELLRHRWLSSNESDFITGGALLPNVIDVRQASGAPRKSL